MSLSTLLDSIWFALRGNGVGVDFVMVYSALGALIWAFLLFKVFLQEGFHVAMGHASELPKILVKYLFIAGMFRIWPQLFGHIFDAIKILASQFYPDLNQLLDNMAASMGFISATDQAANNTQGFTSAILGALYNLTIGSLLSLVGMLVLFFCYTLGLVNIVGSMTILAMNLVLGPIFFALAFDRDFRGHSQKWLAAVLSYILLIPLCGAAVTVAAAIAGASVPANVFGLPSAAQILTQLLGPIMSLGVVFSTNKIVNALVGGATGSGAGSLAIGIAGIGANLIPGGAILRSTAAGGRATVAAAASAARTVAGKLSSSNGPGKEMRNHGPLTTTFPRNASSRWRRGEAFCEARGQVTPTNGGHRMLLLPSLILE